MLEDLDKLYKVLIELSTLVLALMAWLRSRRNGKEIHSVATSIPELPAAVVAKINGSNSCKFLSDK